MTTKYKTREEQAVVEVAVTDIHPKLARMMVVGFLAILFLVPIGQVVHEKWPLQIFDVFSLVPFPTESELKEFETDLENNAVIRDRVLPPTQFVLSRGLGAGNEKVYLGRNGWLFYRDAIDYVIGPPFLDPDVIQAKNLSRKNWQADPLPAILKMHEDLAAQNIQLVVMPIPVKPCVLPEKFAGGDHEDAPALHNPSYDVFKERLKKAGVAFLDPLENRLAESEWFLRTDTHWSPTGLWLSTEKLAQYLVEKCSINKGAEGKYVLGKSKTVDNQGDLAAMLKMSPIIGPVPVESARINPIRTKGVGRWEPDPKAEILLLGDSFSNIYSGSNLNWGVSAGLAEQLSFSLQQPVDVIIRNGDGAFATREDLAKELKRGHARLAGKKVVIYEFASRELAVGNWKVLDFPHVEPKENKATTNQVSQTLVVEGLVQQIMGVPKPGTVPYRDAVTSIHLVNLEPELGNAQKECVLFLWGMRNNKWTNAAKMKQGDQVKFKLVPWDNVRKQYEREVRLELDDPDFVLEELSKYWAEEVK